MRETKKKLRIAKFTLNGYFNYGNLLQNYALQHILQHYADQVDTIWIQEENFLPDTWWNWSWKEYIKYILNWRGIRKDIRRGLIGREMARSTRIRDFAERYISYRHHVDLQTIDKDYDYCIVGSDQVWNPYLGDVSLYFLPFVPSEKRISYAASISHPTIPDQFQDLYKQGFSEMKTLSLREHAGATLVKQLVGREAEVHVDPTLLLTAEEWRSISHRPAWFKGQRYLLTYFLGNQPPEIQQIAQDKGLSLINLMDVQKYPYFVTGVEEFLWAIDHADLFYTDSFHGTVFSILFHTPFAVCNRKDAAGSAMEKMGSRLDTLLSYFGMESRRVKEEESYAIPQGSLTVNWESCAAVLEKERKRSDDYLRRALGLQ